VIPGAPRPGLRLPHLVLSGHEQMRLDEALLLWAAAGPGRFAARTYEWARPTLSLGRAEPFPGAYDAAALDAAGIDVVRRPTGGDAVLHDEEVTFAVAASVPGPWAARPREFATLVAEALAAALRGFDLPASVVGREDTAASGGAGTPGAHPCFARAAAGEVRIGEFKAAGIASRFTRGAALSHASVPLTARHRDIADFRFDRSPARDALRKHARSVGEALGAPPDPVAVTALLFRALEDAFSVRLVAGALSKIGETGETAIEEVPAPAV
jgi:lipoate-protein ligase A